MLVIRHLPILLPVLLASCGCTSPAVISSQAPLDPTRLYAAAEPTPQPKTARPKPDHVQAIDELHERIAALEQMAAQAEADGNNETDAPTSEQSASREIQALYRQQIAALAAYLKQQETAVSTDTSSAESETKATTAAATDAAGKAAADADAADLAPIITPRQSTHSAAQKAPAKIVPLAPNPLTAGTQPTAVAETEAGAAARAKSWREQLADVIKAVELEAQREDLSVQEAADLETYRRLLYVIDNRRDAALTPIEQLDEEEQEYWRYQLHSLLVTMHDEGTPVVSQRAALALRNLKTAAYHLSELSALDVRNVAFCSRVDSFGKFLEFKRNEFHADQEVLLYVEVDNFTVEKLGDQYETELQGSYEIYDTTGSRVAVHDLPLDKQQCRNHRRDYFIAYRLYMPKRIEPGDYTLQLTVEDVKGNKFGQASVDFRIK